MLVLRPVTTVGCGPVNLMLGEGAVGEEVLGRLRLVFKTEEGTAASLELPRRES